MEVDIKLQEWNIETDDKTKQPEIQGEYQLFSKTGKKMASEKFNQGYSGEKIVFSPELMVEVSKIHGKILAELKVILT